MSLKLNSSGGGSVTIQEPTTASDFTLTLPASTGTVLTTSGISAPVEFPAGSVSLPSITASGDTNTGMFFPAADTIAFAEGGTEVMRIDSSARIGFGVTPFAWGGVVPWSMDLPYSGFVSQNTDKNAYFGTNMYYDGTNWRAKTTGSSSIYAAVNSGAHQWFAGSNVSAGAITTLTTTLLVDASGVFWFNSGYGSAAPAYGCRAWVNFNGQGTVAIRASGNVSSITDNGTGDYTVNLTTAMPDANYAVVVGGAQGTNETNRGLGEVIPGDITTSSFKLRTGYHIGSMVATDYAIVNAVVIR